MKPKEKAIELRNKFRDVRWDIDPETSKACAYAAVNEILDAIAEYKHSSHKHTEIFDYWMDVKNELKKL
ncbi:MAG: hypothetical protein RIT01_161 [Pseudomonadota bacterium]|jgi:hypothetical protein